MTSKQALTSEQLKRLREKIKSFAPVGEPYTKKSAQLKSLRTINESKGR